MRTNSLSKGSTKGVIEMAQDEIDRLQPIVDAMNAELDEYQAKRKAIATSVALDRWEEFTEEELVILHSMLRETNYSNENILVTSLDTIATTVDVEEELYQDASKALAERSRPQLSFSITLDNLFALEEYAVLRDDLTLLHYIRVGIGLYEDQFEKLRVVEIQRNPLIDTEELTLTFSNMTYSLQGASDFAYLFEDATSGTSGSSSSSSGGGVIGTNDAEIQISNNMLNALLKSKPYANSVGQVLMSQLIASEEFGNLFAQSGLFDKLEAGYLKVSGDCVTDHIKSSNYNASTGVGSYLALKNGTFTYADGKLTWNGTKLHIDGGVEIGSSTGNQTISNISTLDGQLRSEISRATSAEGRLSSLISQTESEISTRVEADGIISAINQSAEKIKISANKVDISGLVSFSDLSGSGTSTINGSNVTTGKISSKNGSSWIDLDNNTFNFGNGGLVYDRSGNLTLSGDLYGTNWSITKNNGFQYSDANKIKYGDIPLIGEDISSQISWNTEDYLNGVINYQSKVAAFRTPFLVDITILLYLDKAFPKNTTLCEGLPRAKSVNPHTISVIFYKKASSGDYEYTTTSSKLYFFQPSNSTRLSSITSERSFTSGDWVCHLMYIPE